MRKVLVLAALLGAALPVHAQAPAATSAQPAAIDPAQLTLARSIVLKIAPNGTYRKVMQGAMDQIMDGMVKQTMSMPIRQFLAGTSIPQDQVAKLGNTNIRDIMAILDPVFDQRMHITMSTMMASVTEVLSSFEPQMREGMAEAYARTFTPAQLADIARFFNTPAGAAYAEHVMTIMNDPAVKARMADLMPALIQSMPKAMEQAKAATASLPKPKTEADLSDVDRERLAKLLGVDPAELKKAKSQ